MGNGWMLLNIGHPINTKDHDATSGLSPDGQKLLTYMSTNKGDIYECTLNGANWSQPEILSKSINTDNHESSACYSPDGRTIYFIEVTDLMIILVGETFIPAHWI